MWLLMALVFIAAVMIVRKMAEEREVFEMEQDVWRCRGAGVVMTRHPVARRG